MGHIADLRVRRRWKMAERISYLAFCIFALLVTAWLISGCATSKNLEDMRERAEKSEAEFIQQQMFTGYAQDDNSALQTHILEMQTYIRELEAGMIYQAAETAKLRKSCDL